MRFLSIARIIALIIIWSVWTCLFSAVVYYEHAQLAHLIRDLLVMGFFAWGILDDDPPANYPSYKAWRAARKARLAKRKYPFTPLPNE